MSIEVNFSEDKRDQMNLSRAGGYITIKPNGTPVFKFDNLQQYQKYLEISKKDQLSVS